LLLGLAILQLFITLRVSVSIGQLLLLLCGHHVDQAALEDASVNVLIGRQGARRILKGHKGDALGEL
jgi:hypothetical protein